MAIAALYIRQSVKQAGELGNSPAQQESAGRRHPAVRALVAAGGSVETYRDINESGGDPGRADFLRWMARIEEGAVSVAYVYDAHRLSRDVLIGLEFIKLLQTHPQVTAAHGKDGTFDIHSADGRAQMRRAFDEGQTQREKVSEKMVDTHANLHEHGLPTGPAPYGYVYSGTLTFRDKDTGEDRTARAMVPDPTTADTLRWIFETYAEGASTAGQIAQALKDKGTPAPVSNRNKRNPKWSADIIRGMLANRAYLGEAQEFGRGRAKTWRGKGANKFAVVRPVGEWIPAQWDALVSRDLFQRCHDLGHAKSHGRTVSAKRQGLFTGLLYCPKCGRKLSPSYFPKDTYYRCGSKDAAADERCYFARHAVKESDLVPDVEAIFSDFLAGIPAATPAVSIETAKARIAKLQRTIKNADARLGEETITPEEFHEIVQKARAEIKILEAETAKPVNPVELFTLGQQWASGNVALRAAVLNALWSRIDIQQDDLAANELVITKLTPRADRAEQAHALVMAARQSVRDIKGGPDDDEGHPYDLGPGAAYMGETRIEAHPSPPDFVGMTTNMTAKTTDGFLSRLRFQIAFRPSWC